MALKLKATAKAAKFEYADGRMTVSWDVDASLTDDELVEELRRIVAFYDAQTGKEPLPVRWPGVGLEVAQMAHPAPVDVPAQRTPANGWAVPPIPARLEGEVELIPPEEQG